MSTLSAEPSRAVEDYVKAIHEVAADDPGSGVGTSAIATRMQVTPASASGMVRRLEALGLVDVAPYRGATLTDSGERLALSVIRRHRLLETFLSVRLGLSWDRVHAEAEVLEHVLSSDLEEAIARDLGDPERDPHGAPIPRADGSLPVEQTVALSDIPDGCEARFVRIPDERSDMLRWLSERSIAPGCSLKVVGREPFGGPMSVEIDGRRHSLGSELAETMRVQST
jgi:DtxR family Mn-dependent transcriptional regulator